MMNATNPANQTYTTSTTAPTHFDDEENETLNIIVAVSISVTLTLLLFLILILLVLYRKRFDCFLCTSSKSNKASMGSMDDINISTIGRYYDILKSPMRKFSLTVLSDRKSSSASRKLSESSQVPESSEFPRRNHVYYLNSHLCPPSQNFSPRSLGEEEIKTYEEESRSSRRYGDRIVIPHIVESDDVDQRHSPRLDNLRLLNHSAPTPVYKHRYEDTDNESLDSPFSRTPRLDDHEAIFGKPEKRRSNFEDEISNMRDIDESSDDIIDECSSSYADVKRHQFGQSLETLSPSLPTKSPRDRNSYDPRNEALDSAREPSSLNSCHHQFRSEGWLLDSPSVPPKIAPRLPPKQAINKSEHEIQVITKELQNSSIALSPSSEYEDYDNPPSPNHEFEDYDIPSTSITIEE